MNFNLNQLIRDASVATTTAIDPAMARRAQRANTVMRLGAASALAMFALVEPAAAQSLKATAVTIFLYLYGLIGVVGGIACVVCALNWTMGNFLGREDPKKTFMMVLLGTGLGLGVVALIQFVKDSVGGNGADISNL